jgi:hypothetical protein
MDFGSYPPDAKSFGFNCKVHLQEKVWAICYPKINALKGSINEHRNAIPEDFFNNFPKAFRG